MFTIEKSKTFRELTHLLPPDLIRLIFHFWIGHAQNDYNFAFNVTRYEFIEGMEWFLHTHSHHSILLNQMLYGSALIPNIELSLYILDHGATDLETAISLALENGYMPYVRALLYLKDPNAPLPLNRWVHFLENKSA